MVERSLKCFLCKEEKNLNNIYFLAIYPLEKKYLAVCLWCWEKLIKKHQNDKELIIPEKFLQLFDEEDENPF